MRQSRPDYGGLAILSEAQEAVERTGERSLEAELHRMRAELLLAKGAGGEAEAEQSLGRAVAVARAQGARLWELRAASSLARLWREQGRPPKPATCSRPCTVGSPKASGHRT